MTAAGMTESTHPVGDAHASRSTIDLYWLPLGAGGRLVPRCGRAYERVSAARQHRRPRPLFHSALEVVQDGSRHVIEMAPVWSNAEPDRGVVLVGPVGSRALGRLRAFQYEVRCWPAGRIPDVAWAVESPRHLAVDDAAVARVLAQVASVPPLTWGRDELGAGEMWNSNSLVAWLLATSGLEVADLGPPRGGRAPGWDAGLLLAGVARSKVADLRAS
jgi:hypothetical protein